VGGVYADHYPRFRMNLKNDFSHEYHRDLSPAIGNSAYATPCAQLKSKPDTWVATKVNAPGQAARRAYENDECSPPTTSAGRIATTFRQCKLSKEKLLSAGIAL